MITQEQLSDFEINKEVAKLAGVEFWTSGRHIIPNSQIRGDTLDYCNNPNDIMPIAFENGISLFKDGENYRAISEWYINSEHMLEGDFKFLDNNPLRAICEVFILMKQGDEK